MAVLGTSICFWRSSGDVLSLGFNVEIFIFIVETSDLHWVFFTEKRSSNWARLLHARLDDTAVASADSAEPDIFKSVDWFRGNVYNKPWILLFYHDILLGSCRFFIKPILVETSVEPQDVADQSYTAYNFSKNPWYAWSMADETPRVQLTSSAWMPSLSIFSSEDMIGRKIPF